jgi:hypothetical protein
MLVSPLFALPFRGLAKTLKTGTQYCNQAVCRAAAAFSGKGKTVGSGVALLQA